MKVKNFRVRSERKYNIYSAEFIFDNISIRKKDFLLYLLYLILEKLHILTQPLEKFSKKKTIWFKIPKTYYFNCDYEDAFFICAVPMAFQLNENLYFEGKVSKKLFSNIHKIKPFLNFSNCKSKIFVKNVEKKKANSKYAGQFFTLGLDSFYTLLRPNSIVQKFKKYLIYVDGYDVSYLAKAYLNIIHNRIRRICLKTNHIPIFIKTNVRQVSNLIINWNFFHGAALATAGLFLSGKIHKLYFNASDGYNIFFPWGTKTNLDPLWSTEALKFDSYGENDDRVTKINKIMKSPFCRLFLHNLRVCYQNFFPKNTIDNCSVCEKCIRTQLAFIANDIPVKKLPFMPFQEKWLDNIHITSNNFTIWKNLYRYLQKIKLYNRKELLLAKLRWLFKREKIDIN